MSDACECGSQLSSARGSQMAADNYVSVTMSRVKAMIAVAEHGDQKASRLVSQGGKFTDQLHSVMHNPSHPGVNYLAIGRWVRKTEKLARRYGITDDRVESFLEAHA